MHHAHQYCRGHTLARNGLRPFAASKTPFSCKGGVEHTMPLQRVVEQEARKTDIEILSQVAIQCHGTLCLLHVCFRWEWYGTILKSPLCYAQLPNFPILAPNFTSITFDYDPSAPVLHIPTAGSQAYSYCCYVNAGRLQTVLCQDWGVLGGGRSSPSPSHELVQLRQSSLHSSQSSGRSAFIS